MTPRHESHRAKSTSSAKRWTRHPAQPSSTGRRSFRQAELRLEQLEARLAPSTTPSILLTPSLLTALRQEAQANTSQWQSYESYLNSNLTQIIPSGGAYEASLLTEVADYALGYQVLMNINPTLANEYAGRAMALMQSGLNDYQVGTWMATQYLARGNGSTVSFTLPNTGIIPGTLVVYTAPITVQAVTHGAANGQDAVQWYEQFIKASKTSDGNADYTQGVDWQRNGNYAEQDIDWSLGSANQPAAGATYYVTMASRESLNYMSNYTLSGNTITFTTAPTSNQAIFVQYEYGNYQQTSAGDGGFNNIFIDTGYGSRYLGQYESIGLDWLNGYSGMTAAFQTQVENMLQRWFSYLQTNGYYYGSIASNYGAGEYISNVYTALALNNIGYAQGATDLAQMVAFRTNNAVPMLTNPTNSLYGGFWAEGWNYGQLAAENDVLAGVALYDAGAIPNDNAEAQWASQVTQDLITAAPTSSTIYDGGDWYAFPAPFPGKDLFVVLASVDTNPTTLGYDDYILQNYPGSPNPNAVDFMFGNPSGTASFWSNAPLQDFASGTGLLTARSDWSNNPVWVSLQMGNLLGADHQTYEPGQLQIQQGGNDLLVDVNAYTGNQWPKPAYGNTVMVSDNGTGAQTYLWGPGYWYGSPGVVTKAYEANGNYVYDYGDMSTIYSPAGYPGTGGSVSLLTRQLVYLRPGLIIAYDRVNTTQASFPKNLDWNFMNAPVVNGNSFTETVGQSELFGATFSADPLSTTATSYGLNGKMVQEIVTSDTLQTDDVQYVTAFQVGAAGSSMVGTQQILTSDGRMQGVQMGGYVVLFGRYGTLDLSTPISYQVTGSSSLSELLTNLVPGQAYQVYVDGVGLTTVTADSQGTINFTTPSGTHTIQVGNSGSTVTAATHFAITAATGATAGTSFTATVQALDANNNVVTGYTGTVSFSTSDAHGAVPSNYTFTSADAGSHAFVFTLDTAGTQSITARDTANSGLTGSATIAISPAAAASLSLSVSQGATAGSAFSFTVTALDAYGNVASGYRGTVALSSSDPSATLPGNYTFTAVDAGVHMFTNAAIFDKAGTQTLVAADTAIGSISGSGLVNVSAAAASSLSLTAPASASAGGPFPVTVTALDPYGNRATGYAGTVHFSSSDSMASLPADYAFTSADAGSHTFTVTLSTTGSQTVTVNDTGAGASSGGASTSISSASDTIAVGSVATTTQLSASATSLPFGQTLTLTAKASATGGSTPTGSITFMDGTTVLGVQTLSGGQATLTQSALAVGSHAITAIYTPSGGFGSSNSTPVTVSVSQATTSSVISSSLSNAKYGQAVTIAVTVSNGASGGPAPTGGTVNIYLDRSSSNPGTLLASVSLTGGSVSWTTSNLPVGRHTLTAVYLGTGNFAGSTSAAVSQTVNAASTKTSLSTQASTIVYGQPLTLTATVVNTSSSIVPTGTVTFKDGKKTLGTATLVNGVATLTLTALQAGSYSLAADYSGSSNFGSSGSSGWVTVKVSAAATAVALTVSPNPATVGQPVTLTATVTNTQSNATPTGQVTFEVNGQVVGTANLVNGVATFTTTFSVAGTDTITVLFGASTDFLGSSATGVETIS